MKGAVVRVVSRSRPAPGRAAAFGLGIAAPSLAILMLVGTVVPVLTFTFLASIWFLKVCADQVAASSSARRSASPGTPGDSTPRP